ncbi:5-formyltetrahydrofolate cyclo-ligase [Cyanobium sp. HWJ4-Hawea]|uniref:5-formyltetrahydrofolate cyclo-ligase n=1 Tax=Cyanobium sp. HWJ4-Hawea TaxID=2823713 RepID=UPI0020CD5D4C|nr:5-formyltetrahydrofolate cyclo-ligase [Cyanobium sp. HWJ4-Hawea]
MIAQAEPGKSGLRRYYRQRRQELLFELEEKIAGQVAKALPRLLPPLLPSLLPSGDGAGPEDHYLGISWPLPGEVDLRGLAGVNLEGGGLAGTGLALPVITQGIDQGLVMAYRSWKVGDPLAKDGCGIPAPLGPNLEPESIGCLLVPALALDPRGIRLGYGGGWFDRLRADSRWRRIPAYGVLPGGCIHPQLPRDTWDVPFNGWIDEVGLHLCPQT